jgi:hypothetical protein
MADSLQRFMLERAGVRGAVVQLRDSWQHALSRVEHPASVRNVLGHAIVASALLASTLKFKGTLTLQVQSQGPLELLVVQCTQALALRGVAKARPAAAALADFRELADGGHLAVTIEASETELSGHRALARAACRVSRSTSPLRAVAPVSGSRLTNERRGPVVAASAGGRRGAGRSWARVQAYVSTLMRPSCSGPRPRRCSRGSFRASPCACSGQRRHTSLPVLAYAHQPCCACWATSCARSSRSRAPSASREFCGKRYSFDRVDIESLLATDSLPPSTDVRH